MNHFNVVEATERLGEHLASDRFGRLARVDEEDVILAHVVTVAHRGEEEGVVGRRVGRRLHLVRVDARIGRARGQAGVAAPRRGTPDIGPGRQGGRRVPVEDGHRARGATHGRGRIGGPGGYLYS